MSDKNGIFLPMHLVLLSRTARKRIELPRYRTHISDMSNSQRLVGKPQLKGPCASSEFDPGNTLSIDCGVVLGEVTWAIPGGPSED